MKISPQRSEEQSNHDYTTTPVEGLSLSVPARILSSAAGAGWSRRCEGVPSRSTGSWGSGPSGGQCYPTRREIRRQKGDLVRVRACVCVKVLGVGVGELVLVGVGNIFRFSFSWILFVIIITVFIIYQFNWYDSIDSFKWIIGAIYIHCSLNLL